MSILTYVSRGLKVWNRAKKRLATIVQPSNFVWRKPRPARIYRPRKLPWVYWTRTRRKLVYLPPLPSNLSWKRPPRPKIKRGKWFVRARAKYRYVVAPPPSSLSWKLPRRLKLHSRPLLRFFRPKHLYPIVTAVAAPIVVVWRRLRPLRLHSRPAPRFFRPKHVLGFVPRQPSALSWRRFKAPRLHSRPALRSFLPRNRPGRLYPFQFQLQGIFGNTTRHFRPRTLAFPRRLLAGRHLYPIVGAAPPPQVTLWRRLRRLRLHSRPLARFFRPKHIAFLPAQPSALSWKKPLRPRLHSRPSFKFFMPRRRRLYPIAKPALTVWQRLRRLKLHSRPLLRFFRPKHIVFKPALPVSVIAWKKPPRAHIRRAKWGSPPRHRAAFGTAPLVANPEYIVGYSAVPRRSIGYPKLPVRKLP